MKFLVCAVGQKIPGWIAEGFAEYAKRMPREASIELVEIRPEKRSEGRQVDQLLNAEAKRIRAVLPDRCHTVVLDERGKQVTTVQLGEAMTAWMRNGRDVAFVIGGADGLDAGIKHVADEALALSALTLPHGLARVLLAEQLYRAVSLIKGHPYHRV